MSALEVPENRQQKLYWQELVQLKIGSTFIRMYRDQMGRWVTRIAVIKAIASSSSIAGWAIWHQYAFVWGTIIALAQVLDALKNVFPVSKQYRAASEHAIDLERIFINAQLEFETIRSGKLTDDQVMKRLHTLRKARQDAQEKNFKEGWRVQKDLFRDAEAETRTFFETTYGILLSSTGDPLQPPDPSEVKAH